MKTHQTGLNESQEALFLRQSKVSIISNTQLLEEASARTQLNAFTSLLCIQGEGTLSLNNCEVKLQPNDLFLCAAGNVLERKEVSDDFCCYGFYLSRHFLETIHNIPSYIWSLKAYASAHPVTRISEENARVYREYYNLIRSKLENQQDAANCQIVTNLLIQAFMYEFHDILASHIEMSPGKFTSGDYLFKQFVELLIESYPKPRMIGDYANKLHVTPKYLSMVCKQSCGEGASMLINRYVLNDVKNLLLRPDKSIKEIVNELGFPSVSYFGKYVKNNLGVSPRDYHKQLE